MENQNTLDEVRWLQNDHSCQGVGISYKISKWRGTDSNRQPMAYESTALPLSYLARKAELCSISYYLIFKLSI